MRIFKIILPAILALFCVVCSAAEKNSDCSGCSQYWSVFRQAVIDNDKCKIADLTRFPFEVRGPADFQPIKRYDRKGFLEVYESLVTQPVCLLSNGKFIDKPMRQLIDEKKEIAPSDYLTPDTFQIENFKFRCIKGKWYFTFAYTEEDY